MFFILSGRKTGDFFESADKIGIVVEAGSLTGLGDAIPLGQEVLGQSDSLDNDVLEQGGASLFFEKMAQIKLIHGNGRGHTIQREGF